MSETVADASVPAGPRRRWHAADLAPLFCGLYLLALLLRIQTYASGQDPFIYISRARALLHAHLSAASIGELGRFIAPGFPLLLAGAIRLFGPFAPYWVNLFFCTGAFALLYALLCRLLVRRSNAAVATVTTLYVAVAGYPLNAPFLLYAFRGAPELFFGLAGLWLAATTETARRPMLWLALAGVVLLTGAFVRETVLFFAAGPATAILVGALQRGRRWRALAALATPFLAAAAVFAALLLGGRVALNTQVGLWMDRVAGPSPAAALAAVGARLRAIGGFAADELGWPGLLLLIAGAWTARRERRLWLFCVVPALLLLLFYAGYKAHRRFFLTSLILVAPLIGHAAAAVGDALRRRLARGRPRAARTVFPALGAVLGVLLLLSLRGRTPWGPHVELRQAHAFVRQMAALNRPSVFVDPRCRYLVDAMVCLTDVELLEPAKLAARPPETRRGLFLRPLNKAALYRAAGGYHGAPGEAILRHYAAVQALADPGAAAPVALASARFEPCALAPWTLTRTEQTVSLDPAENAVLWLDLADAGRTTAARAELVEPDGRVAARWTTAAGPMLRPLYLAAGAAHGTGAVLRVVADAPIPAHSLFGIQTGDRPVAFRADDGRNLSILPWFKPPFHTGRPDEKYAAAFVEGGTLALPIPAGAEAPGLRLTLRISAGATPGAPVAIRYHVGGGLPPRREVPGGRTPFEHTVDIPPAPYREVLPIELSVEPPDAAGAYFRILELSLSWRDHPH